MPSFSALVCRCKYKTTGSLTQKRIPAQLGSVNRLEGVSVPQHLLQRILLGD